MNKRLMKRELANLKMLFNIAKKQGGKVFFWSLTDGVCRRFHFVNFYHKTHYKRHEACKAYLKKRYAYVVEKYRKDTFKELGKIDSDSIIWRYWHQGVSNVPYPVDITLNNIKNKVGKHPVKVLDATSYKDYIDVPDYIAEKVQNGQMNIAVFSDYIRLALLKRYGGIWLDSTFYVNRDFPREIDNMSFYTINQGNKRKWVVTRDRWSVCLLACAPNNPLISFCEEFLREYWKNETTPVAYLMTDCIIGIAYDEIPFFKKMIDSVPINNTHCFDFLTEFRNETYNEEKQIEMNRDTFLYQLSYKFSWNQKTSDGKLSNYGGLVDNNNGAELIK